MTDEVSRLARNLVRKVDRVDRRVRGLENKNDLGFSSLEDSRAINEYSTDGTLQSSFGGQSDGTHGAVVFNGPKPPTPTMAIVEGGAGIISIAWDGYFIGARPLDLDYVRSRVADNSEMLSPTSVGVFAAASKVVAKLSAGDYWVQLIAETKPGRLSDPTTPVKVTVSLPVDTAAIESELEAANTRITEGEETLDQLRGTTPMTPTLAEAVAAGTESYLSLAVTQLTAGTAAMAVGVIDKLFADVVVAKTSTAEAFIGENAIITGAITAPKITASEELTAKMAQFLNVTADMVDVNNLWADTAWISKANVQVLSLLSNTDGSGYTSEHTGEGFRVYYTDPITGEVQDRISLGVFSGGGNYFGLTDDNNELSISIDKDGGIASRTLDVRDTITYKGVEIQELLTGAGGMLKGWASRTSSSLYWANAMQPFLHLRFTADAGRSYMVQTTPIWLDGDTVDTEARAHLHYETAGAEASTASPVIAEGMSVQASFATRRSPVTINRLITPPAGDVSLLISYSCLGGRAKISTNSVRAVVLTVIDIGPALPETGEDRNGSADAPTGTATQDPQTDPAPPATVQNYDEYVDFSGVKSYLGTGGQYNYQPSKGYQGLQPYTSNGNLKSLWFFPSVTTMLSGATITDIYAYFYFEHWNYGDGGTARIRTHGHAAAPTTYGGIGNGVDSTKWPRAAGRWVRIPDSLYAGFKSGTIKGLALDGDGTLRTYGIATKARLRFKFTK